MLANQKQSIEFYFKFCYSLQQHRRKEHGAKQRKPSDTVADLNKIVEEEGEDGEKQKCLSTFSGGYGGDGKWEK